MDLVTRQHGGLALQASLAFMGPKRLDWLRQSWRVRPHCLAPQHGSGSELALGEHLLNGLTYGGRYSCQVAWADFPACDSVTLPGSTQIGTMRWVRLTATIL